MDSIGPTGNLSIFDVETSSKKRLPLQTASIMYQWIPIIGGCLWRKTFQKQSRKCRQCAACTLTKHQSDQLVRKERLPRLVCGCEQRTLQKERRLLDRAQASWICTSQLRAHSHWRTHPHCRDSSQAREAYLHYTNAAALLSDRQKQHTRCSNKCTFTVHTFTVLLPRFEVYAP